MNPEILAAILERLTAAENTNARQQVLIDRLLKALTRRRDSLIMDLGGTEEALGLARSIEPRHKRKL